MRESQMHDYPKGSGITFENVWDALMEYKKRQEEDRRQMLESYKRLDKQMKEDRKRREEEDRKRREEEDRKRMEEDRKQMKEDRKQREEDQKQWEEVRKQMKETGKRMGDLNNSFGELAEHLVAPGIRKRFNELGYHFGHMSPGGYRILDKDGKHKTEIDILLENDDVIIAVEVKVKPKVNDVEHHIGRLKILREYRSSRNDTRKILGAIAGAIFGAQAKAATIKAGMYVIEQSGDTMKIDVPADFIPIEW